VVPASRLVGVEINEERLSPKLRFHRDCQGHDAAINDPTRSLTVPRE
jgi:hypothetical protein